MSTFLVVLDVDSTLIENEVIDLLADAAGSRAEVAAITAAAMNGELDFETSLRSRCATLAGLPVSVFEQVGSLVQLTTGVPELVTGVHRNGGLIAVVSGGFHEIVDPLADALGLDRCRANRLDVRDGLLTGGVRGEVVDAQAKADTLREWAADFGIPMRQTIVVGDGANDLEMMAASGLSVGFDAKAPVREEADVIMDVRDLTQVLPLLGLRG
ncbi:MAG: phosphoserine phosphatase SerB [Terrimesophilobacter sp.]